MIVCICVIDKGTEAERRGADVELSGDWEEQDRGADANVFICSVCVQTGQARYRVGVNVGLGGWCSPGARQMRVGALGWIAHSGNAQDTSVAHKRVYRGGKRAA